MAGQVRSTAVAGSSPLSPCPFRSPTAPARPWCPWGPALLP